MVCLHLPSGSFTSVGNSEVVFLAMSAQRMAQPWRISLNGTRADHFAALCWGSAPSNVGHTDWNSRPEVWACLTGGGGNGQLTAGEGVGLVDQASLYSPYSLYCSGVLSGIPELSVPPMEPLVIPRLAMENGNGAVRVRAAFNNMTIRGGSNYTIMWIKYVFTTRDERDVACGDSCFQGEIGTSRASQCTSFNDVGHRQPRTSAQQ
jgi:hypothetical protein